MSDKPTPMMFDFLSMDGNFDEVCDRLFGYNPSTQSSRADDEVRHLEDDVQNLDDLIDRANPGAKERMDNIRRSAAIDLILKLYEATTLLKCELSAPTGKFRSDVERESLRELIGEIVDLKVAYCSLEEEKKAIGRILEDSIKVTSLNIRNSQELYEKLFEAKKELAAHNVLSGKLYAFQRELRSRGLTTKFAVEDLLLALDRVSWYPHNDSNGKFLQLNEDCQHPCCVHGGRIIPEPSSETPTETTEPADTTEEVVSEVVATAPAEVAVPSPAPRPAKVRKTRIVTLTERNSTRKPQAKKAAAKTAQAPKPAPTEKPKGKRRPPEGGWGPAGW